MQNNNILFRLSLFIVTIIACLLVDICLASNKSTLKKLVTIIQIVEHPALNITRQGILDELKNSNVNIEFQSAQDNSALAAQIAQKFISSSPDVLVGIGTSATQSLMAANKFHQFPIVFSSVTDPKGAKIVDNLNAPEGMVTGVSNFADPAMQFDFFKKINDTYGHAFGDLVLVQFAEILMKRVRKTDIPARYGGEEFVVLLPNTSIAGAVNLAEKIRVLISNHLFSDGMSSTHVHISAGISTLKIDKPENSDKLVSYADAALYIAKEGGRNRVCQYENTLSPSDH